MSNARQETIDDIVKEIRGNAEHNHSLVEVSKYLTEIADRIEAAQICGEIGEMVGREATCKKYSQIGNAAAMRKALETINRIDTRRLKRLLCELVEADILDGGEINKTISAVEKARQALSAPPRNCDIGTAEEQIARFNKFCFPIKCSECQLHTDEDLHDCIFRWSQMPYEEG